jgi:excisionase family DNA binding protein
MSQNLPDRYLTVKQVATILNLSEPAVRARLRDGRLPGGIRLGGDKAGWRVKQSELDAWLESRARSGAVFMDYTICATEDACQTWIDAQVGTTRQIDGQVVTLVRVRERPQPVRQAAFGHVQWAATAVYDTVPGAPDEQDSQL